MEEPTPLPAVALGSLPEFSNGFRIADRKARAPTNGFRFAEEEQGP